MSSSAHDEDRASLSKLVEKVFTPAPDPGLLSVFSPEDVEQLLPRILNYQLDSASRVAAIAGLPPTVTAELDLSVEETCRYARTMEDLRRDLGPALDDLPQEARLELVHRICRDQPCREWLADVLQKSDGSSVGAHDPPRSLESS